MKALWQNLSLFLVLTLITGGLYPLFVTTLAQLSFNDKSHGSLVKEGDRVVGSTLIAQKFSKPEYFWARPSAGNYETVASSASNLGPSSQQLKNQIAERRAKMTPDVPEDLITTSASGLDPHISPAAAFYQIARVAKARNFNTEQSQKLTELVHALTEKPQYALFGESRINVLALNLALDAGLKLP